MREIKFRAWDKNSSKIYPVEQWSKKSWVAIPVQVTEDDWELEQRKMEDVVIMQFTSLLDKNGKEIYEGDVVKCRTELDFINKEIVFENGMFAVLSGEYVIEIPKLMDIEVIGNIYEHPELLNQ